MPKIPPSFGIDFCQSDRAQTIQTKVRACPAGYLKLIFYEMRIEYSKTLSDSLKAVGVASMLVDHIGLVFFPQMEILRIIGRLAFPIFAVGVAGGYQHTSDLKKYALRLFVFGLLAQFPYQYLMEGFRLNVMFTLLAGLLMIYFFDTKKYWFFAAMVLLLFIVPFEYDFFGPAVVFFVYFLKSKKQILIFYATFLVIYIAYKNHSAYLFFLYSIFGIVLALYPKILEALKFPKLPRYFFYVFYPAHLALFALIKYFIL